ncbi:hypothetical protein [Desulfopila sp. IMCC35006]|uniref:hypothetical protein n=1 Tax=Desulfopila sp. IMCC35006 TaxID=2569542 RepID=UPI00129485D4|nr:hypothetical protein [Desulfopila sp. IMCC35006]
MKSFFMFQLSLLTCLSLTAVAFSQTAKSLAPMSYTLLYSSNVSGEYEPCGG